MAAEAVFVPKALTDETLAQPPVHGKHQLQPLAAFAKGRGLPVNILEDHQVESGTVELHRHQADLWLCLEGEATFQTGGRMVSPVAKQRADGSVDDREWSSQETKGATTHVLRRGDILCIPAGVPHVHTASGTARLYIIKLDQPLADGPVQ